MLHFIVVKPHERREFFGSNCDIHSDICWADPAIVIFIVEEKAQFLLRLITLLNEGLYAFAVVFEAAAIWEVKVYHNFTSETWTISFAQIVDDLVFLHSYVEWSDSFVRRIMLHNLAVDLLQDWIVSTDLHMELFDQVLGIYD